MGPSERRGRTRGPLGIARAWIAVLTRPGSFFRTRIAPGEQAPGLTFAIVVVVIEEALRLWLVPEAVPVITDSRMTSALLVLLLAALLVTPAALHLLAGLQTVLLVPLVEQRAGVSQTVQVIAYATAPCVFAGVPIPGVRVVVATWAAILLVIGISSVHRTDWRIAAVATAIPAALAFGYGFRGFAAVGSLLEQWYVI